MENSGETLVTNDATDALITVPLLAGMIAGVLDNGRIDPTNPLANPLYADFTGFPRLYVNAGSVESLLDNATRVAEKEKAARVDGALSRAEAVRQVIPVLGGEEPEADPELSALAEWHAHSPRPACRCGGATHDPDADARPRRHRHRCRRRRHLRAAQTAQR